MTIKQSIWSIWGCLMFLSKASFNSSSASFLGRVHQGHWSHQTTKSCCLEVQHVSSRVKTMEIYGDHGVLSGTKHCQTQRKQHFSSTVWLKDPFRSLNSLVQAWPNQTCRHIPTFRTAGSLHVAHCNKTWPLDTFDSVWLNLVHLNCIPNVWQLRLPDDDCRYWMGSEHLVHNNDDAWWLYLTMRLPFLDS